MNCLLKGDSLTTTMNQRRKYTAFISSLYETHRNLTNTEKNRNYKYELLQSIGTVALAVLALEAHTIAAKKTFGTAWKGVVQPILWLEGIYWGGSQLSYAIGGDVGVEQYNQFIRMAYERPTAAAEIAIQSAMIVAPDVATTVVEGYAELGRRYEENPITQYILGN